MRASSMLSDRGHVQCHTCNLVMSIPNERESATRRPAEGADTIAWRAASPVVEGRSGRFFFDRQAFRTHWLPTTHEASKDWETLWRSSEE